MKLAAAFLLLLLPAVAVARPLTVFTAVAVSPDGSRIASVETSDAPVDGEPAATLFIRTIAGAAVAVVPDCTGHCQPSSPAWSPDGKRLSFLVATGGTAAIEQVGRDGGRATTLVRFPGPLDDLRTCPSGRLAVLATANATRAVGRTQAAGVLSGAVDTHFDEQRIAVLDNGRLHWASPPDLYVYEFDAMPGGGFVGTAAHGDGDSNWWVAGLYRFNREGPARLLYQPPAREQIATPVVSPDGRSVAFVGGWMSDFGSTGGDAFLLALKGAAAPVDLTPGTDGTVTALSWRCGPDLTATMLHTDEVRAVRLDGHGEQVVLRDRRTLGDGGWNEGFSCAGGHAAAVAQDFTHAPSLLAGPLGALRTVADPNAGAASPVGRARSLAWTVDNHPVEGWLLEPAAAAGAAGEKRPLVVVVHGGPEAADTPRFPHAGSDVAALLGQGWDVMEPNYRGSYGQGEAFAAGSIGDLGGGDWRDTLGSVDAAERAAPIDDARLAITGGSYGGYMSMWAVTQTRRFAAAMADAGVSDWLSIVGEAPQVGSDEVNFGGTVWQNPEAYLRASPVAHMANVRTPTLIIVGDRDRECPVSQSLEFHTALQTLHVPESFVVYKDEGHGFDREADRRDRTARTIAWFHRWFDAAPGPASARAAAPAGPT